MEVGLIPQRYAKALYKFALENNQASVVYTEMLRVVSAFQSNAELTRLLSNPFIGRDDKETVLLRAVGVEPSEDYRRFVRLVLDHKREEYAYLMALSYRDIYRKDNRISQVNISTACELPEVEMQKLRDVVEKSFRDRKFEYSYQVEPDLIGGFQIDVDSVRLDASVRNELAQLRQNLLTSN